MGYFDDRTSKSKTYLGKMNDSFKYILENDIDYIYCITSRLSRAEIQALSTFADNNLKKLKIIPDNKEVFTRTVSIELYDSIPVLAMRKSPLELEYARAEIIKKAESIHRLRLEIFYFETWSLGLDINSIYDTVNNALLGEEKHIKKYTNSNSPYFPILN